MNDQARLLSLRGTLDGYNFLAQYFEHNETVYYVLRWKLIYILFTTQIKNRCKALF